MADDSVPNVSGVDSGGGMGGMTYDIDTNIRTTSTATQTAINKIRQGNIDFSKSGLAGLPAPVLYGLVAVAALYVLKKV